VFQLAGFQEFVGHLQILCAGIIEETLLSVKLCQLQHALKRRLELADLLVHGDSLDRESLGGIGIAHTLKTVRGLVVIAHAGVEVSNRVTHREILGIILEDLVVLSDGILQLALLDILLRSAEDLLFIEPETERHIGTNSSPWSYRGSYQPFLGNIPR